MPGRRTYPSGVATPEGRGPRDSGSNVLGNSGQERCVQTIYLGLSPMDDSCSFSLFSWPATAWIDKWLGMCYVVLWIDKADIKSEHPRVLCDGTRKDQACDSSSFPSASRALSSILATWLDHYSKDFCQPPSFRCLKLLLTYLVFYMPGSEVECRLLLLLEQ